MNYNITIEIADKILNMMGVQGYTVSAIYEQSFRAIRTNEYILSEINVELMIEPELINYHNLWEMVSMVTRYACPIESKKPENIKEMKNYIKWLDDNPEGEVANVEEN